MTPQQQGHRWSAARRNAYEKRRAEGRPTRPIRPDDEPFFAVSHAAREAMHAYLDNLESVLVMISQRDMEADHMDRMAVLLQEAERDLLRRCTTSGAKARKPAPARSSIRSRNKAA